MPKTGLDALLRPQDSGAPEDTAAAFTEVILEHAGGSGIAFGWETELLNARAVATV
jgi:hypothetical protein